MRTFELKRMNIELARFVFFQTHKYAHNSFILGIWIKSCSNHPLCDFIKTVYKTEFKLLKTYQTSK